MATYTPQPVEIVLWDGKVATFKELRKVLRDRVGKGDDLLSIVVTLPEPVQSPGGTRIDTETVIKAQVGEYVVFDPARPLQAEILTASAVERRYPEQT